MPIKEINILRRHGKQFVPDLRKAMLPGIFRGRPVIGSDITAPEAEMLHNLCPVGAIDITSVGPGANELSPILPGAGQMASVSRETAQVGCTIDLGRCVFCRECEFALPDKIRFTHDYKMASNVREGLIVSPGNDQPITLDPAKSAMRSVHCSGMR